MYLYDCKINVRVLVKATRGGEGDKFQNKNLLFYVHSNAVFEVCSNGKISQRERERERERGGGKKGL